MQKIKILICTAVILLSGGILLSCDAKIKSISAYDKIELSYGEALNLNSLVLNVKYSNGKINSFKYSEIKNDLKIVESSFSSTKSEQQNITLEYMGFKFNVVVDVKEPKVSNIIVNTSALGRTVNIEKVTNTYIQNFLNKISVSAIKQDSSSTLLNGSEYNVFNYDNITNQVSNSLNLDVLYEVGEHWFAVVYKDLNPKTFCVTVKPSDENGFEFDRTEIPTQILLNENVDFSKLIVNATYSDGRKVQLSEGKGDGNYKLDLNGFNNTVCGQYTIKVKYKNYIEKAFTIDVVEVIES